MIPDLQNQAPLTHRVVRYSPLEGEKQNSATNPATHVFTALAGYIVEERKVSVIPFIPWYRLNWDPRQQWIFQLIYTNLLVVLWV